MERRVLSVVLQMCDFAVWVVWNVKHCCVAPLLWRMVLGRSLATFCDDVESLRCLVVLWRFQWQTDVSNS
jgi:hypothetical protein